MQLEKQTMKKLMLLIAFAIVLFLALMNIRYASDVFWWFFNLLKPFVLGLSMAFVANVPMHAIETRLFAGLNKRYQKSKIWPKLRRPFSLLLTILFILGIVSAVLLLLLPELGRTIEALVANIPAFLHQVQEWITNLANLYPQISEEIQNVNVDWNYINDLVSKYGQEVASSFSSLMGSTISVATNVFNGIFTFTMGCIFAIYTLTQKEKLQRQVRRLLYAYLPEKKVDHVIHFCSLTNRAFSNFIAGQCTEACILGTLCFIGMNIFRFPYALLISVLVAFMALIPIFGAFFSAVLGGLLILTVDPLQAFYYVVFFLVLQQLEGNLIYPRVVGSSVGLPPIWVLLAVTVGGNAMGLVGMILSIPLCSVIYMLLRENIGKHLKTSRIDQRKIT